MPLNIMAAKKKYSKFRQGTYTPKHADKYIGKSAPRYLSSWELKFFRWCDDNINVVKWSSENIVIPYLSPLDNKIHRYIVDNTIHLKEGNSIVKYLIEIKPKKQTCKPTSHGNKKKSTIIYENVEYIRNQSKWKAARGWCKKHGYIFQILTEDDLFR